MTKNYKINGIDCPNCAKMIEVELEDCGIKCSCSFEKEMLKVEGSHNIKKINSIISKLGCNISIPKEVI